MATANNSDTTRYQIKKINLNDPRYIITQNENGPCSLLGLANVLLLRSTISLPPNLTTISTVDLLELVADLLLSSVPDDTTLTGVQVHESKLNSAMEALEHLPRGMEADVKFAGVSQFSWTPGIAVFSLLGVPLYHAWLVDPALENMASMIGDLSYCELVDKIITYKASGDHTKNIQANAAQEFLESNQMTAYGLSQLAGHFEDGQLGVLFRNNHFVTVCKRNGVIYQLVTDEGYLTREDIVWETLTTLNGVGKFVNQNFEDIPSQKCLKSIGDNIINESFKDLSSKGSRVSIEGKCTNHNLRNVSSKESRESTGNKSSNSNGKRKSCPQGHSLRYHPAAHKLDEWNCNCCGKDYFGEYMICYQCREREVCKYDMCGGCYFKREKISGSERAICPGGHMLKPVSLQERIQGNDLVWMCKACGQSKDKEENDLQLYNCLCSYVLCRNCYVGCKAKGQLENHQSSTIIKSRYNDNKQLSGDRDVKVDELHKEEPNFVKEIMKLKDDMIYGIECGDNKKMCPAGHQLEEVAMQTRYEEEISGYGGWACSRCNNNSLKLKGQRYRCDQHNVKSSMTPSTVDWRCGTDWGGRMECAFDLCGECYRKNEDEADTKIDVGKSEDKADTKIDVGKNEDYRKQVIENIKKLLLKHPNGLFERFFSSGYSETCGQKINFEKLGYPSQKNHLMNFLGSLSGSILEMEYRDSRLYINPTNSLLNETIESPVGSHPWISPSPGFSQENLPTYSLDNSVSGVRRQVMYPDGLEEGDSLDIIVTEVISPAKFWFQLRGTKTSQALDILMDGMEEFYRNHEMDCRLSSDNPHAQCKPGDIMAAPFQDYGYHRVHINEICRNNINKVRVFYVDFGTIARVPISSLRFLDKKFSTLPSQALEAKLWGLAVPGGGKKWSAKSSSRLLELVEPGSNAGGCYSIVKRVQSDTSNRVLHLELFDTISNDLAGGIKINQLLVKEGLADSQHILDDGSSSSEVMERSQQATTTTEENIAKELRRLSFYTEKEATHCSIEGNELGTTTRTSAIDFISPGELQIKDKNNNIKSSNLTIVQEKHYNNHDDQEVFTGGQTLGETIAAVGSSVGAKHKEFVVIPSNLHENTSAKIVIHDGKAWMSSGDISSLMPSWRGKDLLARMIQMRKLSIKSLDISSEDGLEWFEELVELGMEADQNSQGVEMFKLYLLDSVPKLVNMFNKDVAKAKKINEAVEAAIRKLN